MLLTQIYPQRVGKVVIDGVVSTLDWTKYQSYLEFDLAISDAEAVWKGFLEACVATGRVLCPITRPGDTVDTLNARVDSILNSLAQWTNPNAYSYQGAVGQIYNALYNPSQWSTLASFIASLTRSTKQTDSLPASKIPVRLQSPSIIKSRENKLVGKAVSAPEETTNSLFYILSAIQCSDAADPIGQTTEDVFREMIRVAQTVSPKFGSAWSQYHICHAWGTRAVERYTGTFDTKPPSTVLVLGNQADPITPFRNSKQAASAAFLGSSARLIQRWDYGHCTISERTYHLSLLEDAYLLCRF